VSERAYQDPDRPLSDRERELVRRLLRWEEVPAAFKAALTDYVSVNGSLHVSSMPTLKGEEWREVGATGQPAFVNSWANVATYNTAAFYKDALGIVHLKGMITSPAGAGTGNFTTAFTLPEGFRPAAVGVYPSRADTAGTGRGACAAITSTGVLTGNVDGVAANTVVTNFTLDGIHFRAS
jgi:hypothetical protein